MIETAVKAACEETQRNWWKSTDANCAQRGPKLTENFTAELRSKNVLEHAEKKTKAETKRALMKMKEQRDSNQGANANTWN